MPPIIAVAAPLEGLVAERSERAGGATTRGCIYRSLRFALPIVEARKVVTRLLDNPPQPPLTLFAAEPVGALEAPSAGVGSMQDQQGAIMVGAVVVNVDGKTVRHVAAQNHHAHIGQCIEQFGYQLPLPDQAYLLGCRLLPGPRPGRVSGTPTYCLHGAYARRPRRRKTRRVDPGSSWAFTLLPRQTGGARLSPVGSGISPFSRPAKEA
jgi:hypothetical protein